MQPPSIKINSDHHRISSLKRTFKQFFGINCNSGNTFLLVLKRIVFNNKSIFLFTADIRLVQLM